MDQATEPAQTTVMATKVASPVMRVRIGPIGDLLAPGRSMVGTTGRRGIAFFAGMASQQRTPGLGRAADISPTSHVGKLAGRAEARGHLTVDERRTRDANRFRVSTDNSAKRSESGRWS
jgi:hypothetical protein